ncbi:MAG: hypothetical protein HY329_24580 [Chloroflexi bacterium]|nr:hypothetical protein [Chloroflexota bacterium]
MREHFVELVRRYVSGEIALDELEDWETPRFEFFGSLAPEDPVARLWGKLHLCVAELDLGHRSEEKCRKILGEVLEAIPVATTAPAGPNVTVSVQVQVLPFGTYQSQTSWRSVRKSEPRQVRRETVVPILGTAADYLVVPEPLTVVDGSSSSVVTSCQ